MRHRVAGVKLGRTPAHRRALLRNLVTALLEHEVVRTTDAKAKELRRWGDRVITLGKQGTLHARRRAGALIRRRSVVKKLFDEIAPRFADRAGGYTRVVKLGARHGDAAALSVVELVERAGAKTEKAAPKKPPRRRAPAKGNSPPSRAAAGPPPGEWRPRAAREHRTGPQYRLTPRAAAHTRSAMPAPRVPDPHPGGCLWRRGGADEAPR